ncbi:MAG: UDP-N-acetylmuramoyl-L-alanyl-D-glutamate--2,6-diaminopimelate ligase [Eubacteriaceae bacterium]|nr:UDP-N-acetylmuramoyl-L-alanyl-D-glutamate--2,6-diaminopimelate ligase [Eubacteriaceae bacterium]
MRLLELLPEFGCEILYGSDKDISSLMIHSKNVSEKAVFFAVKGERHDGIAFVDEAKRNGAVAVVMEGKAPYYIDGLTYVKASNINAVQAYMAIKLFRLDELAPKRVGVTGTNGKTSFTIIASEIFTRIGHKSAFTGTLGTNIQGFDSELTDNTTYPPALYAKLLSKASSEGYEYVFSEVSSQGIALNRVNGFSFGYAVFLNLTQDHLDFHGDMEEYFQQKSKLFGQTDVSVINISDEYGKRLYDSLVKEGKKAVSFAIREDADYCLSNVRHLGNDTEFTIKTSSFSEKFVIPMLGEHNAVNASLAVTIAHLEGLGIAGIKKALLDIPQIRGRLEKVYDGDTKVYIDYAHTPDALVKSIDAIRQSSEGQLTVVFGCGGGREAEKRCIMGRIAAKNCDLAIITTDNPRNENPNEIISHIISGIPGENDNYIVIPQRAKAIEYALAATAFGNVLIAGKGHEEYILVGDEKLPFSDKGCVQSIYG